MAGFTDKKIEYITIATRIMEEEGVEALSIRRVAREAGCTSAVLYRHFENKDHLMMLASVKFLNPYIQAFMEISDREDLTAIQQDLELWRLFIYEAFRHRDYYQLMFFNENRELMTECVLEYFQMFPQEQKRFDGFTASIIFSSNLSEREMVRLRRAVNEDLITMEDARLLSRMAVTIFNGAFLQIPSGMKDEESLKREADECFQMIYKLFGLLVKPGTRLDL